MERDILQLLSSSPGTLFSLKEIGKKVDRNRYREDPNWARAILTGMVRKALIEKDDSGHYFVPEFEEEDDDDEPPRR